MTSIYKSLAFFNELEKLKTVNRQNQTLDGRQENAAEHSWQVALMAPFFQQYFPEDLNLEKVMLMLLLHEIGEIGAGDSWAYDEAAKATSFERELASVKESLSLLPKKRPKLTWTFGSNLKLRPIQLRPAMPAAWMPWPQS